MNPRIPEFQLYSSQDSQFLFGADTEELQTLSQSGGAAAWHRVLADAGVGDELALVGVSLADFPTDRAVVQVSPDSLAIGSVNVGLDLATVLLRQFQDKWEDDQRFEGSSSRWRITPDRVQGYVPGDVGSLRWSLLHPRLMEGVAYGNLSREQQALRIAEAEGAAWAYLASPHFIPAGVALDVVTATPPPPEARAELRLPARYTLIFHDGIPVPIAMGAEDEIEEWGHNALINGETLLLGAIVSAHDDGSLYEDQAFLIVARRHPEHGWYGWQTVRVRHGEHPSGRVLYNYAALLSWEGWTAPPKLRVTSRGKAGSARSQRRKVARSQEAAQGGWHGVRVLDYRPAPEIETSAVSKGSGVRREREYQGERRAHWTKRTRIGFRDERERLVGPVYGPEAVEGVTFERRRVFVRRAKVREDLPVRPAQAPVYRLPGDVCQVQP